jgi:hypothetical protein
VKADHEKKMKKGGGRLVTTRDATPAKVHTKSTLQQASDGDFMSTWGVSAKSTVVTTLRPCLSTTATAPFIVLHLVRRSIILVPRCRLSKALSALSQHSMHFQPQKRPASAMAAEPAKPAAVTTTTGSQPSAQGAAYERSKDSGKVHIRILTTTLKRCFS